MDETMKPFTDLLARYPGRRLQISERDYDMAREELLHQDTVPLIDPALALATVQVWEGVTKEVAKDASPDAEVLWIEIHTNGEIEAVFPRRSDQTEEQSTSRLGAKTLRQSEKLFHTKPKLKEKNQTRYLNRMPKKVPTGRLIIHNHIRHTTDTEPGINGFRVWTRSAEDRRGLVPCQCGWANLPHYKVAIKDEDENE